MRRISYAGESFVTTDGVADALLRLVAALGANHTAAAIEVPAFVVGRGRGGDRGRQREAAASVELGGEGPAVELVRLVAGPSSEMISRQHDAAEEALAAEFSAEASAAIVRLNARTTALGVPRAVIHAHPQGKVEFDFDGLESL
ncbi:hypothetical protein [Subtercola lobariae]|uniref:Uncharacterized protein n=1 Tax=Subtercola lobariae TaxID=1588641 RepID=A0A917B448_9MICO|nr:hypothetical protein [Subtercola lobariae]GGF17392.1 hypothetical protein GCM10011399_08920 [Subtercola lobariae]